MNSMSFQTLAQTLTMDNTIEIEIEKTYNRSVNAAPIIIVLAECSSLHVVCSSTKGSTNLVSRQPKNIS